MFTTSKSKKNRESILLLDGISALVTRKSIKNLHLKVLPPNGDVKVSAPHFTSNRTIKNFITQHKTWINQRKTDIAKAATKPSLTYSDNEHLYYLGETYKIRLTHANRSSIKINQRGVVEINIRNDATFEQREHLVYAWYRKQLKIIIPELLIKWQPIVGKSVSEWGVKKMKTRWGSCNISAKRIWLNAELAKKPIGCLEMVLLHELVHLHEQYHNKNFYNLMDKFMPNWQQYDALLIADDLEHENVNY